MSHTSTSTAICGPSNDFIATAETGFGTTNATFYSSTLSGTASPILDGTLVDCFGSVNSVDPGNRVGGSTLRILGQ